MSSPACCVPRNKPHTHHISSLRSSSSRTKNFHSHWYSNLLKAVWFCPPALFSLEGFVFLYCTIFLCFVPGLLLITFFCESFEWMNVFDCENWFFLSDGWVNHQPPCHCHAQVDARHQWHMLLGLIQCAWSNTRHRLQCSVMEVHCIQNGDKWFLCPSDWEKIWPFSSSVAYNNIALREADSAL